MSNYLAMVFKNDTKAHEALKLIWKMDDAGDLTVHSAAIVRRDSHGFIDVASKYTDAGLRTAIGVGVGVVLGALAGPVGVAAGVAGAAALSAGTAVGVGAMAGGAIGLTADAIKSEDRTDEDISAFYSLQHGESAVVADVSEIWPEKLDEVIKMMGGVVHRKHDASDYLSDIARPYYNYFMYPYYYIPQFM